MTHRPCVSPRSVAVTWDNGQSGTGRCANTDPLLDRIDLVMEGSGPMAIMPAAESTGSNPPETFTSRMSRVDGCPECVVNAETPSSTYDDGPGRFVANYVCQSCGHAWTTSWTED